jgi:hypothetical protein
MRRPAAQLVAAVIMGIAAAQLVAAVIMGIAVAGDGARSCRCSGLVIGATLEDLPPCQPSKGTSLQDLS